MLGIFSLGWVAGILTCVGIAKLVIWKQTNNLKCGFCNETYKLKESTCKYKTLYCSDPCYKGNMASDFLKEGYTSEQVKRMTGVEFGGRA
jgi:hypothetical protein